MLQIKWKSNKRKMLISMLAPELISLKLPICVCVNLSVCILFILPYIVQVQSSWSLQDCIMKATFS